jgi:hypothetical protein
VGFGDALVKAAATGARGAANAGNAATDNHAAKKPVEKKQDAAPATASKSEKSTQAAEPQPVVASTPTAPAVVLPPQASATSEKVPADEATGSEDVLGSGDGASKQALAPVTSVVSGIGSARWGDASAQQQGTNSLTSLAKQPGTTSISSSTQKPGTTSAPDSEKQSGATWPTASAKQPSSASATATPATVGEKRPVTLHQQGLTQVAGGSSKGVQGQGASDEAESNDQSPVTTKPSAGDAASGENKQVATSPAAPGSNADASTMFGIAFPALPIEGLDASGAALGLNGSDGVAGVDLSSAGLSSLASGTLKAGAPGGSAVPSKAKAGSSDGASAVPSAAASLQKTADAVPGVTPAAGSANANANADTAQANTQAATTVAGAAHTDAKSGQHGTGDASGDSAGTASTTAAPQSWDASATQVVHRAQLIQAMHQSEMRMGMNSAEFGNISISAAVSHQTLSAQISLDHPELNRALTAQLPEIEKKLGSAYGLPSRVEVRDSSTSSQQGSSRRDAERSQSSVRGISNVSTSGLSAASFARDSASSATYLPAAGARLDILI